MNLCLRSFSLPTVPSIYCCSPYAKREVKFRDVHFQRILQELNNKTFSGLYRIQEISLEKYASELTTYKSAEKRLKSLPETTDQSQFFPCSAK